MAYQTTVGTETLKLCLGFAFQGLMVAGSASLNGVPGTAPAFAGFTPADVGCVVMVIVGDPAVASHYTDFQRDGAMVMWSTIAAYVDATHVTLADNAPLNTPSGQANAVLYRPVAVMAETLQCDTSLTSFATSQFSLQKSKIGFRPPVGMPVLLMDTESGVIDLFGGTIDQVTASNWPGTSDAQYDCLCVGWELILQHRATGLLQANTVPGSQFGAIDTSFGLKNPYQGQFVGLRPDQILGWTLRRSAFNDALGGIVHIKSISNANPGHVETYTKHGFVLGQSLMIAIADPGSAMAPNVIGKLFTVSLVIDDYHFTIGVDTTGWGAYIQDDAGWTSSTLDPSGPDLVFSANNALNSDVADQVCQAASSTAAVFSWFVDPRRVVRLVTHGTIRAPFDIKSTDGSDGNALIQVQNVQSRQKYFNRVNAEIKKIEQSFLAADESGGTFTMTTPVQNQPTVSYNGTSEKIALLPGGGPDHSADFYYQVGSATITQDPAGPGSVPYPIQDGDVVVVAFPLEAFFSLDSTTAQAIQASIESGSGFWEQNIALDAAATALGAIDALTGLLNAFSKIPDQVTIYSYRPGLAVGQTITINLPDIDVLASDGDFLIDSSTLKTDGNRKLWTLTASRGALIGDWKKQLKDGLGASGGSGASTFAIGGTSGGAGGVGGSVTPIELFLTAATTIVPPKVASAGDRLIYAILQDGTGHAVTWGSMTGSAFKQAPTVPVFPNTLSFVEFIGRQDGNWWWTGAPLLGVSP